jgi:hypothetical protein
LQYAVAHGLLVPDLLNPPWKLVFYTLFALFVPLRLFSEGKDYANGLLQSKKTSIVKVLIAITNVLPKQMFLMLTPLLAESQKKLLKRFCQMV